MEKISVIMPVYNGETTLQKALDGLFFQSTEFSELIVVDDMSADKSLEIIRKLQHGKKNFQIIRNNRNLGLAKSYNVGIKAAQGGLIVTMHQDIVLEKDSLSKLTAPFADKEVVAAGHADIHPLELWRKCNFWQKCFFSRFQRLNVVGINGQFDAFRKSALEQVGMFDGVHFKSAGEDGDIVHKLKKIGKVVGSEAKIIHLHKIDPNFSWRDIIRKQAQYSEAQGALFSLGRIGGFKNIYKAFFREMLVITLLVPYLNMISLFLIIIYSFKYTGKVYLDEYRNPRVFLLPFFNVYLLFVSLAYSIKGFLYEKQRT